MISVEHLSKTYGSTTAIQDVTFAVEPGEILGFLGPNGAGKTTTMRILTGYLPATTGTARIAGYDVHENSMAVRQKIGYLPEIPPLYPEMSVEGYLNFVARLKRVSPGDRPTQVNQAILRCGLEEKRQVTIRKLSKGFRQRVGIAQAIVHNPPVIILDEPTVGLDPRQIIEVRNLIKSLAGDHTIILCTHILPEVSMTCSQVAIINRGVVVASDSLENLIDQTQSKSAYEVELEAKNPQLIQQMIQDVSGVTAVQKQPREHLPANRYRFRVTADPAVEVAPEITSSLSLVGVKLYEMRRLGTSLEDVFLRLTSADMPANNDQNEKVSILPSSQEWWDEPIAENPVTPIDVSQVNSPEVAEKYPPLPSSLEWWDDAPVETESSPKKRPNPLAFLWNWFKKGDRQPVDQQPVAKGKQPPETKSQKTSQKNSPKTQIESETSQAIPARDPLPGIAPEKPEISSEEESSVNDQILATSTEPANPKLEVSSEKSDAKLDTSSENSEAKLEPEKNTKTSDTKLQVITKIKDEISENVVKTTESNLVDQTKELGEE
jgi:ABC-2 type transport system ATP-binding protein